jgi:hypothetical protein
VGIRINIGNSKASADTQGIILKPLTIGYGPDSSMTPYSA